MRRKVLFAPSLLGADPLAVGDAVEKVRGCCDWLHLDVMDGHFVRNISFGSAMVKALRKRYPDVFLDVHLMLDRLDVLLPAFIEAGASQITIHAETEPQQLHAELSAIRSAGLKAGVALAPPTGLEDLSYVQDLVDLVLVMSVTPGFGGQSLIGSVLEKTRDLVRLRAVEKRSYLIQMDGGIHAGNVAEVALAGCDVVVAGSAVFNSPDPALYLNDMRLKVKEALADAGFGS